MVDIMSCYFPISHLFMGPTPPVTYLRGLISHQALFMAHGKCLTNVLARKDE